MKKQFFKQSKGITLIALVITIVILIILATISINAVLGEDGLIKRAEKASQMHANGVASEQDAIDTLLGEYANAMADIEGNDENELPEIEVTTPVGTVVKTPSTWTTLVGKAISDGNGTAIPLPSGFYYVGGDYDTGLVISDKEGDTLDASGVEMGNQFVWIPVESDETFIRESFENSDWDTTEHTEPFNYTEDETTYTGYEEEETEYNTMRTQVLKYGGFYIGRYEAGVNSTELTRSSPSTAQEVVSKKGVAPYNYVGWGESMTEIGTNGAVYIAQNMYTGKVQATSVTSTLIYGVQWDVMCRYIGDYTRMSDEKNDVELTGSVSTDVSKNIYDLAGNCSEWSMEAYNTANRVIRGGHSGEALAVSYRYTKYFVLEDCQQWWWDNGFNVAFRCSLYVK